MVIRAILICALICFEAVGARAQIVSIPNAGTTGTTIGQAAKLTGAPSTAVETATTDTSGIIGCVAGETGTSATTGNALIAIGGQVNCATDGSTTAGDYAQISSTTAGDLHDAGSSIPTSGQIVGRFLSTNSGAGTYTVEIFSPGIVASAGSLTGPASGDLMVSPGSTGAATGIAPVSGDCALGSSSPAWIASANCLLTTGGQSIAGTETFTGAIADSGTFAESDTALPTQAAGTLGIAGEASAPTLAANGEADLYITSTTGGITLIGQGSTNDFTLLNKSGSSICVVATGTTTLNCVGLDLNGTALTSASTTTVGTSGADLCLLNSACTFSGADIFSSSVAFTGTSLPTQAAGTLGHAGEASTPTLGANGEGDIYLLSTTGGLALIGEGSTYDISVYNKAGTLTCSIATGTTTLNCGQLALNGNALTSASYTSIGTSGATIPLLDTANTWSAIQTFDNSDIRELGSSTGYATITNLNSGSSNYTFDLPVPSGSTDTFALLGTTSQQFAGGFLITPYSIGTITSSTTLSCANGPSQWMVNGTTSAITINAPAVTTEGQCLVAVINAVSTGTTETFTAPTFSGFLEGSNTGDAYPTTDKNEGTCTWTSASPGVATYTQTDINGEPFYLTGTTAPTGLTFGTVYYVTAVTGTTLELAATPNGTAINTTSTGTSVSCHTASVVELAINRIDGMPHYLISALQ